MTAPTRTPRPATLVYTRPEAKPLIITYNDGIEFEELNETLGIATGAGFGERDAFAALSLDDGATWKNYNLSDSADRSSFVLKNGHAYPGDVFKMVHAVEGNMVVAAWISRYCESGAPLYSWLDEEKAGLLTAYPELDHPVDRGWRHRPRWLPALHGRHVHRRRHPEVGRLHRAGLPRGGRDPLRLRLGGPRHARAGPG